jgi:hypothetical protein
MDYNIDENRSIFTKMDKSGWLVGLAKIGMFVGSPKTGWSVH